MQPWTRWQDWTNLLIGVWLLIAPWALATSGDATSTWTAVLVGATVILVAVWALAVPGSSAAEWSNVLLGAGLVVAPWTLGFVEVGAAAWNAWISGSLVALLALAALPAARGTERTPDRASTQAGSV